MVCVLKETVNDSSQCWIPAQSRGEKTSRWIPRLIICSVGRDIFQFWGNLLTTWAFTIEFIACPLEERVYISSVHQGKASCLTLEKSKDNHSFGCTYLLYFPLSYDDHVKILLWRWFVFPEWSTVLKTFTRCKEKVVLCSTSAPDPSSLSN